MAFTYFYNRSAYGLTTAPVPQCFLELDQRFDASYSTFWESHQHRGVQLATVLALRLGDIAYFGEQIGTVSDLSRPEGGNTILAGIAATTLVVAHLSACKAALDAGAIAVSELYSLGRSRMKGPLAGGEVDFGKGALRNALKTEQPGVETRYSRFFALVDEVVRWRDAAIHRNPPLITLRSPGPPGETPTSSQDLMLSLTPDATIASILGTFTRSTEFSDPLHFHRQWYDQIVAFAGEVCTDIAAGL